MRMPRTRGIYHLPKWSRAVPTERDGIRFPSKTEARVYERLKTALAPDERIVRQASFPLLSLAPDAQGKVQRFTPDFIIVNATCPPYTPGWSCIGATSIAPSGDPSQVKLWVRVVEAKGGRLSRDYKLRRDAFMATFGRMWEWDGNGDPPWTNLPE